MTPQLDCFSIVVSDMAASLAFYRALGLDIPAPADTQPHAEATLTGGVRLCWDTIDTIRTFDPGWQPPTGGHRIALAFRCANPSEVDRVHDELVAAGHTSHLAPFDAVWGQRYATILDPDQNAVDLYAALPSAEA